MAIALSTTLPSGAVATYHKIRLVLNNIEAQPSPGPDTSICNVFVDSYLSQAIREAGGEPLVSQELQGLAAPLDPTRALLYPIIMSLPAWSGSTAN